MPDRRYTFAAWWHLLSLDAPTVAVLWAWLFARAMHLRLPSVAMLLLGLATWLLYVADRILHGLRKERRELLRDRHIFPARHRRAFLSAALILAGLSVWMALTRMYPKALREDLFLVDLRFALPLAGSCREPRIRSPANALAAQGTGGRHHLRFRDGGARLVPPE